jgi:hypothetical protein
MRDEGRRKRYEVRDRRAFGTTTKRSRIVAGERKKEKSGGAVGLRRLECQGRDI